MEKPNIGRAEPCPPENKLPQAGGHRRGAEVSQGSLDSSESASVEKTLATMRARLALAGWTLHVVDNGSGVPEYWVGRWGQSRTLPDCHALARFAEQVGVRHG